MTVFQTTAGFLALVLLWLFYRKPRGRKGTGSWALLLYPCRCRISPHFASLFVEAAADVQPWPEKVVVKNATNQRMLFADFSELWNSSGRSETAPILPKISGRFEIHVNQVLSHTSEKKKKKEGKGKMTEREGEKFLKWSLTCPTSSKINRTPSSKRFSAILYWLEDCYSNCISAVLFLKSKIVKKITVPAKHLEVLSEFSEFLFKNIVLSYY